MAISAPRHGRWIVLLATRARLPRDFNDTRHLGFDIWKVANHNGDQQRDFSDPQDQR